MIVLGLRRATPEPPIVLGQIFLLQKPVGLLMRLDLLQPHFLHQAVLVGAVVSLHSTFRLWRIGRDDANPQALAHLPKLRHRHHPLQLFLAAGLSYIHILPIRIQRHRYAVFLHPGTQHSRRPPRSSPLAPAAPACLRWHRPPCSSSNHADLVPPASHESFHPSVPAHPYALSVLATCDAPAASAPDSIALLITSSAAGSAPSLPHGRRSPSARPLT